MRNRFSGVRGVCLLMLLVLTPMGAANELPPCGDQRPTTIVLPWSGAGDLWCLEGVVDQPEVGPIGYTQIVTGPDDTLYAVLPQQGQLVRIEDTDSDALPDTPVMVAENLERPTGLTYHDDALYIAGMTTLYRYDIETDALAIIAEDFPGGWTGYPSGGLQVQNDWLYVGAGGDADCSPGRGAVWRFSLDGSDGEIFAEGIAAPSDITLHNDVLYVVDSARDRLWELVEETDYGACSDAQPDFAPAVTFEAGAAPVALAAYPYDTFPIVTNRLLVALSGTGGEVIVPGYEVLAVDVVGVAPDEAVLPRNPPHLGLSDQRMHIQGSGFWPDHVYGVAVDERGWIYVSSGNGKIVALRPL
jgi:glucose/arabinose dehydrogenase